MNKFDVDHGIRDIEATIRALRDHTVCSGKVGVVGFCLGGKLAYLSATRTDADATVGYYAVVLDALLGESPAISRPLFLHIPEEYKFVRQRATTKHHTHPGRTDKVHVVDDPET